MREIKFRAWEKNLKEIIPVHNIDFEKKMINTDIAWRLFDEIELIQYTGLKDKNGKEIFEGDILEVKQNYLFKIIWHEESWGYEVIKNEALPICGYIKGHVSRGGLKHYNNTSQVIGNIFANPEVLEAAE
jgi:uncharacterized phage protein (TIGR01671 family)